MTSFISFLCIWSYGDSMFNLLSDLGQDTFEVDVEHKYEFAL